MGLPYMPFFVDAYVLDAGHLSEEEHGAYMRLLCLAWATPECRLPNDDAWLARRLSRPVETVQRLYRPIIAEFWQSDGNWLWQKRQRVEFLRARKNSKSQSDNAKSRWRREKPASDGTATAMPTKPKPTQESRPAESLFGEGGSGGELAPASPPPTPADKPRARRHATKASRLPSDWPMTPERMAEACSAGLTPEQAQDQHARFTDYWRAAPGSKGTKLDWPATWRNWCRKAADDLAKRPNGKARDGPKPFNAWVDASREWLEQARKLDAEDAQSQELEGTHPRLPRPH